MKRFLILICIVLSACAQTPTIQIDKPNISDLDNQSITIESQDTSVVTAVEFYPGYEFIAIHSIDPEKMITSKYTTEGFVAKIFTCPECKEGLQCKPCMGNNIVVSEDNKTIESYNDLTEKDWMFFVDDPKKFSLGIGYKFALQIIINDTTNEFRITDFQIR